jgi:hypothetical protein
MATLGCPICRQLTQFEAIVCDSCGSALAFDPVADGFRAFDRQRERWVESEQRLVVGTICHNARVGICNWFIGSGIAEGLCLSCRHNRIIPDLAIAGVLDRWRLIEQAKRRMIYTLIRLGLPLDGGSAPPLMFDLLYDPTAERGDAPELLTGHSGGVITLNIIEAEDVARERMRRDLGEPYRTLLGHFRHEVAHYYWHRLVEQSQDLRPFRTVFGDERIDYQQALINHYRRPPPKNWQEQYVSAYAAMHPWEDFAETFAHYLHIVDAIATLVRVSQQLVPLDDATRRSAALDPYSADMSMLAERWIPNAFALNAINRAMGQRDLYPFRLTPNVMIKLDFVQRLVAFAAGRWTPGDPESADLRAMIAVLGHRVEQPQS